MRRPVKRLATLLASEVLCESAVMRHPNPRAVNQTDEADNSVNPTMGTAKSSCFSYLRV
jgi:hypothetical protein